MQMMSPLMLVRKWMQEFEVKTNRDAETVQLYSKLINEELKELELEFKDEAHPDELKEAVDLIWVTLGKVYALGYTVAEISQALALVYNSNMSKLCKTEEEAIDYVNANPGTSYRRNRSGNYLIFNTETNKVLKGPNYEPPIFNEQRS